MSMSIKASPDGTYGEILVNGAVVAKLPVTGNAVIPGLVGTVSQSGGVPTGAVVERGSNANGEYVRFADGTQICTRHVINSRAFVASGNIFVGGAEVWTFPATFANTNTVVSGRQAASNAPSWIVTSNSGFTTGSVGYQVAASANTDSGTSLGLGLVAIGRWY
jgi:hypothetical protein